MDEPTNAAPTAAPPLPVSPFAAPATTAASEAAAPPVEMGDTSYLDNVASREPILKPCTVPGGITSFEIKQSQGGDDYIAISVQVFGDKMVNMLGQPVSPGKRISSSVFPFSKPDRDKVDRKGRDLRNLLFALRDVPLDGNELKVFATWPAERRPGILKPKPQIDGSQRIPWSLHAFLPTSQWVDKKVMVQVKAGTDMDGEPRNEFVLLAASTKPVERKGRP